MNQSLSVISVLECTFDAGIKEFCDWVNKQELQKDKYEESIFEMKEKGLYK